MSDAVPPVVQIAMVASLSVYAAGLLWFWRGARRGQRPVTVETDSVSLVSVVVAARNEGEQIEACLRGLAAQDYPTDRYEIVLVDDGSTDGTGTTATDVATELSRDGARVTVLNGPSAYGAQGSKKAALALGISRCGGEIVLTTDADCTVPNGWVRSMVTQFSAQTGAVIGFSQIGVPGTAAPWLARWEGLDFLQLMTAAAGSCAQGHPMAASGQSLGFRRQAFDEVGGYAGVRHRVSGDDVLLLQLIRRTGRWQIRFCGERQGRVVHPPSPGLRSLLSRRARWASNAPLQLRLDPLFFSYMVATFGTSLGLLVGLVLGVMGVLPVGIVGALWGAKIIGEGALAVTGARRFERLDLLRVLPSWFLLQPLYTVAVGLVGPLGFFRWKGRRVSLGRR